MPLSYDYVEKPPQVRIIDQFFSGSPEEIASAYETATSLLRADEEIDRTTDELADSGDETLSRLTHDDANHFREHWLDSEKARHPWSGPDVGRIMRETYLAAVEAASSHDVPIPIETFWVFSPIDHFEMRLSESATQITVFALIPKTDEIVFNESTNEDDPIRRYS